MHDLQDHAAGSGAALGSGVDADGLLSSTCVLLTVDIDPTGTADQVNILLGLQDPPHLTLLHKLLYLNFVRHLNLLVIHLNLLFNTNYYQ